MKATIYIVDDEEIHLRFGKKALEKGGYNIETFIRSQDFLNAVDRSVPDLVLVDMIIPEISGAELIKELRKRSSILPIVVVTADPRIESAIQAIKNGANEYLRKPINPGELNLMVEKLLDYSQMREELQSIQTDNQKKYSLESLVGECEQIQSLKAFIRRVIEYPNATILLTGESGTGKGHVGRIIHYSSQKSNKRFVDINCAAIPEALLESELFGFEKGAFTDARAPKKGLFEIADGGTVLMDEVNSMSASLQAKLLSFIETRSFRRLGSVDELKVDLRLISTTNSNLNEEIARKNFREDLYYRINVVSANIPPLRERGSDVIILTTHFINEFNNQFRKHVEGLTKSAEEKLLEYEWPGNVRELHNVIEHAMIFTDRDTLDIDELVLGMKPRTTTGDNTGTENFIARSLSEVEAQHISDVLNYVNGDTTKAAEILGISRKNLWEKRKKLNLE
ncbi:MAG: sigma-54-dependent Fis family transcriptional regulator [Bacteroidota bacterium]|nr:sigma-54-dependent Fis family transcriptional regulator [Bacteroidota bacterium]